ncbi:MAG: hypothetical protein IME99_04235, partial [Proteobacteria bacterium]|nr:hypothetical protein [Pseudomonadota bacterium]
YPLFTLKYAWLDNQVQSMDVGFRIDPGGDDDEEIYFVRTLPGSVSGMNRFEIDLLREVGNIFPGAVTGNEKLVGVDLFPHKRWGVDLSEAIKEGRYSYYVKGMQVSSNEGSVVTVFEDNFEKLKLSGKSAYFMDQKRKDLLVPVALGGSKGIYKSTEFTIPLSSRLQDRSCSIVEVPFKVVDKDVQHIRVWAGYDTSGNGRANEFVPVGRRVPLFKWNLVTRDMKEPMLLHEAKIAEDFHVEYTTQAGVSNVIILRNGKPLAMAPGKDFHIAQEQVYVEAGKVLINLPSSVLPGSSDYVLYYMPKEWIQDSSRFPGFKKFVFGVDELKGFFPGEAAPVELKFVLVGRLPENSAKEKEYEFYFKAPVYKDTVLPQIANIKSFSNMPTVRLDSKEIKFSGQEIDQKIEAYSLKGKVYLEEGQHILGVNEPGALEVKSVYIKPVSDQQSEAGSYEPPGIAFKKVNPTRYVVDIKEAMGAFTLVFNESFNEGWKAYVRLGQATSESEANEAGREDSKSEPWSALLSAWGDSGKRIEIEDHFVVNGYANGWRVPVMQSGGQVLEPGVEGMQDFIIILEYKPQRLFEIGLLITVTALFGCLIYLGYGLVKRRARSGCRE